MNLILALNTIWFALAFHAFYIRRRVFAKVVVREKADRDNTAYEALIEQGRFMGGFNLAPSALAHASQFFGALQNRQGKGLWSVFEGVMPHVEGPGADQPSSTAKAA